MELTPFQELLFQMMMVSFTTLLSLVSYYIKSKIDIEKYGFENDIIERILDNAVSFTEREGEKFLREQSRKLSSYEKLEKAKEYINRTANPKLIRKHSSELEQMISRKVAQKFNVTIPSERKNNE